MVVYYLYNNVARRKNEKRRKTKMVNEAQKVTTKELLGELKEAMRDCFVGKIEEKEGYIQVTLLSGQVFSVCVKEQK